MGNPNFDLANLALKAVCPNNEIKYDDKGMPSIMVKIPKMTYAQLGLGVSTATFPAFLVNGQEVDAIYISKYMNIVQNGRAYSLPGQDYANTINFDNAQKVCTDKGAGWHLMTAMEWGLMINWCENNGFIPLGNCDYGKYHTETNYKAIPMTYDTSNPPNILHTAGGTGPLEWFHDKTPSGIADLCGNGYEWTGGVRSCYGELQIMANNNAADVLNPQTAKAVGWKAISASDGSLIDPDVDANGDCTGQTTGSIKMDWVSSKLTYGITITDSAPGQHNCLFKDITCSADISDDAKGLLRALGFLPRASSLITTYSKCFFDNSQKECCFYRGGTYYSALSSQYGFASFYGYSPRTSTLANFGLRAAYCELPAA